MYRDQVNTVYTYSLPLIVLRDQVCLCIIHFDCLKARALPRHCVLLSLLWSAGVHVALLSDVKIESKFCVPILRMDTGDIIWRLWLLSAYTVTVDSVDN